MRARRYVLLCMGIAACGGGANAPIDAMRADARNIVDAPVAPPDAVPIDTSPPDAMPIDAIPADAAPPCLTIALNPTSQTYADVAQVGLTFQVTTDPTTDCGWTATTGDPWITVVTGSGNGSGTVRFDLAADTGVHAPRTGSIDVSGQTFSVIQDGPQCAYTITPSTQTVSPNGGTFSADVATTPADCDWTPTSGASWISPTDTSTRTGSTSFDYVVDPQSIHSMCPRTGSLTFPPAPTATVALMVTEAAAHPPCFVQ